MFGGRVKGVGLSIVLALLLHPFAHAFDRCDVQVGLTADTSVECPLCITVAPEVPEVVLQPLQVIVFVEEIPNEVTPDSLLQPTACGRAPPPRLA